MHCTLHKQECYNCIIELEERPFTDEDFDLDLDLGSLDTQRCLTETSTAAAAANAASNAASTDTAHS